MLGRTAVVTSVWTSSLTWRRLPLPDYVPNRSANLFLPASPSAACRACRLRHNNHTTTSDACRTRRAAPCGTRCRAALRLVCGACAATFLPTFSTRYVNVALTTHRHLRTLLLHHNLLSACVLTRCAWHAFGARGLAATARTHRHISNSGGTFWQPQTLSVLFILAFCPTSLCPPLSLYTALLVVVVYLYTAFLFP